MIHDWNEAGVKYARRNTLIVSLKNEKHDRKGNHNDAQVLKTKARENYLVHEIRRVEFIASYRFSLKQHGVFSKCGSSAISVS